MNLGKSTASAALLFSDYLTNAFSNWPCPDVCDRESYPSTFAPPVRPARPIVPKRPRPTRRFFTQTIGHAGRTMRA